MPCPPADNPNRKIGNLDFGNRLSGLLEAVTDLGTFEVLGSHYAPGMLTAFGFLGGVKCGIVGTEDLSGSTLLTEAEAVKAAGFISFCHAFSIPLVTFINTSGLAVRTEKSDNSYAGAFGKLARAYASATIPKVSVILGKALGGSFAVMGSKALGADVVYALEDAEIGAMKADASVALVWNDRITETENRENWEKQWKKQISSPLTAAKLGEVDDIISVAQIRQRLCSVLYMLSCKGFPGVKPF